MFERKSVIILTLAALLIAAVAALFSIKSENRFGGQSDFDQEKEQFTSDYSFQGTIERIEADILALRIPVSNDTNSGTKTVVLKLEPATEYFLVNPSTVPFTIISAKKSDIKIGQVAVAYTKSNPNSYQKISVYKLELLK